MIARSGSFSRALQPLLDRAEALACHERCAWLAELRRDCPTVANELERLLAPHLLTDLFANAEPVHALDMLGLRR